jgi:hypothetical protein
VGESRILGLTLTTSDSSSIGLSLHQGSSSQQTTGKGLKTLGGALSGSRYALSLSMCRCALPVTGLDRVGQGWRELHKVEWGQ